MELDEVADELYGLRPQEFTAARNDRAQQARAEGRRELAERIRGLRRPTLAAWASNLLVREQGDQVAPLLRLGEELRGAHRNLDGEELRALSHQQHQLVNALARQAEQLAAEAGTHLGGQAQQEVAQTLHAVLADPDAAQEWAAGRLSRPLTATPGFDAAAREAAAAPAPAERGGGRRARPRKETVRAEPGPAKKAERTKRTEGDGKPARAAREAREAADQARRRRQEADAASEETAAARAAREEDEERVEQLRGELREAEDARRRSRQREREAERAGREARRKAEEAEEAEKRAHRKAGGTGGGR